jgi:O-antigen/teichoic acid export membrane protein
MTQAARIGVATHTLRYAAGNVLVMVAGFVSFPVLTRLLDTTQYGIFGYFDAWLLLLAGLFKLGAQHTILRFYPHAGDGRAVARFGANFIALPFLASTALWALAVVGYAVLVRVAAPPESDIGWIMLGLLLPTIWISLVGAYAYAQERSGTSVAFQVGQRWSEVLCIVAVVYFIDRSTLGAYSARFAVALVFAVGLALWLRSRLSLSLRDIEPAAYFEGLRYGLPLVANEIATNLLAFADRLMLRQMSGDFAAVGTYTIGYGLALNINNLFNFALYNAYTQVSIREFETQGPAAVLRTKRAVLRVLVYVTVAMMLGLVCVGPDVLLLLAGDDKATSVPVFVGVGLIYTLDGLSGLCSAGLLLLKRSRTVVVLTLAAALVNIALNLGWIPRYGVMGAVYATAVGFVVLNVGRWLTCPAELRALPDARATLIAVGLGAVTLLAAHTWQQPLASHVPRIGVALLAMLILYVLPACLIDANVRQGVARYWCARRALTS